MAYERRRRTVKPELYCNSVLGLPDVHATWSLVLDWDWLSDKTPIVEPRQRGRDYVDVRL